MSGTGRQKSSSVWQVKYEKETDKSICLIPTSTADCQDSSNSLCGKEFNGQFPTNLKRHLRTSHYEQYKCFEAAEKERKEKEVSKTKSDVKKPIHGQSTLNFAIKQHDTQSTKHKTITLHLAKFFDATNVPVTLVDNLEFRELIGSTFQLTSQKENGP